MKTRSGKKLLALACCLALMLTLLPGTARAAETDGSKGITIDVNQTPSTTYTLGGDGDGRAAWDLRNRTLTLSGTGSITAVDRGAIRLEKTSDSQSPSIVVEEGADITLTLNSDTSSVIYCLSDLSFTVKKNARLTLEGSESTKTRVGLNATGNLNISVEDSGVLEIRMDKNDLGIYSDKNLTITNRGRLASSGKIAIYNVSGATEIGGDGMLFLLGNTYGILSQGSSVIIAEGTTGVVAGGEVAVKLGVGDNTFTNNTKGTFVALDSVPDEMLSSLADPDHTVDLTDHSGGLDVTGVKTSTFYPRMGGGGALWDPGSSAFALHNAALTGSLTLPENTRLSFSGDNRIQTTGGSPIQCSLLSGVSGSGSLLLSGGHPLISGYTEEGAVIPCAVADGQYLTVTDGSGKKISGGAFPPTSGTHSVELPATGEFKLAYQTLNANQYVLTVYGSQDTEKAGVYSTTTITLTAAASERGGSFLGWNIDPAEAIRDQDDAARSVKVRMSSTYSHVSAEARYEAETPTPPTFYTVVYKSNYQGGPSDVRDVGYLYHSTVTVKSASTFAAPQGMVFSGWAETQNGPIKYLPGDTFSMPASTVTFYAVWADAGPALNKTDHFAYLRGYPSGLVSPQGNLTREEAAMIFYRLLEDYSRTKYETTQCPFLDVEDARWSRTAIATLYAAGILKGRGETSFDPSAPVTRAEFAAIAARFDSEPYTGEEDLFPDIAGHWAAGEINSAAAHGWVLGTPEGLFKPDAPITRAEAAALLNRVLERAPETTDDLLPGMKTFPDNADEQSWYYLDIQEAANGHDYTRKPDGVHESWSALTEKNS